MARKAVAAKRQLSPDVQVSRIEAQIEKLQLKIAELEKQKAEVMKSVKAKKIEGIKAMIESGEIDVEDLKKLV